MPILAFLLVGMGFGSLYGASPFEAVANLILITNADRSITLQTNNTAALRSTLSRPKPVIQIHPTGATAKGGSTTIEFDGNLNHTEAITISLPGNGLLKGHVTALSVSDASGKRVFVALVKDCFGELVTASGNEVIYRDAFAGLKADVLYRYELNYIEQLIIFRERIQLPEGISLDTAKVEAWTEFLAANTPRRSLSTISLRSDSQAIQSNGPVLATDETLDFGLMRMEQGRAFASSGNQAAPGSSASSIPVSKQWIETPDNRKFLIESVDFLSLRTLLETLPAADPAGSAPTLEGQPPPAKGGSSSGMILPPLSPAKSQVASVRLPSSRLGDLESRSQLSGVVLDFILINHALLNINFGPGNTKVGPAAIGQGTNDFWNHCFYGGTLNYLQWANGSTSMVQLWMEYPVAAWTFPVSSGDNMYDSYIYKYDDFGLWFELVGLPTGVYDLYLYGHGPADGFNAGYSLSSRPSKFTGTGSFWTNITEWVEDREYVVFRDLVVTGNIPVIQIRALRQTYTPATINGLQLCLGRNIAPVANAGARQIITWPTNSTALNGTATDDGMPTNSTLNLSWAWVSGPEQVIPNPTSTNGTSITSTVTFSQTGTYVFRLTASDSELSGASETTVEVVNPNSISDYVWVEDMLPTGAEPWVDNESIWCWITNTPLPFSGTRCHVSSIYGVLHQHYFINAAPLTIHRGDRLFCYIYVLPGYPLDEIMLQWKIKNGGWDQRAYWGHNLINFGPRTFMGALPSAGQWVRLEVPSWRVGLENQEIEGMAFTLYNGCAAWDRAGVSWATTAGDYDTSGDYDNDGLEDFPYLKVLITSPRDGSNLP